MPLNRRQFMAYGVSAAAMMPFLAQAQPFPHTHGKTNIAFVMADDLGREVLCNPEAYAALTPNLNAFQREAMEFRNCYATPLCSTSRAQFLTGQYCFRNGWTDNPRQDDYCRAFDGGMYSIGQAMQHAGYRTGMVGKWQLARFNSNPNSIFDAGFDRYLAWAWLPNDDSNENVPRYWRPGLFLENGAVRHYSDLYGPDVFSDFALGFVRDSVAENTPFFLYYPMVLPHAPYCNPPEQVCELDVEAIGEGIDACERAEELIAANYCEGRGPKDEVPFEEMVGYVDQLFGRFLSGLRQLGVYDSTMIVFTTDNGTKWDVNSRYLGDMVSGGKGTFTELGVNVPLVIRLPGGATGTSDALVDFTDFLPTFAELGGVELPMPVFRDGVSFLPALIGSSAPRQYMYTFYSDSSAISDGRWKMVQLTRRTRRELRHDRRRMDYSSIVPDASLAMYDLESDPLEQTPLYYASVLLQEDQLATWRRLDGARRSIEAAGPRLTERVHLSHSATCR